MPSNHSPLGDWALFPLQGQTARGTLRAWGWGGVELTRRCSDRKPFGSFVSVLTLHPGWRTGGRGSHEKYRDPGPTELRGRDPEDFMQSWDLSLPHGALLDGCLVVSQWNFEMWMGGDLFWKMQRRRIWGNPTSSYDGQVSNNKGVFK